MISVEENRRHWNEYKWPRAGEEWSKDFGTAYAQWHGFIYPRIFPFLNGKMIEIAPGFGRWTQFLLPHCSSLIGFDITDRCIRFCQNRFSSESKAQFLLSDGSSLTRAESKTIDFVFSFDSLVHAEENTLAQYVTEIARVLKPNGAAFIHHSNLAAARRNFLDAVRGGRNRALRSRSMSAAKMRSFAHQSGMSCIRQEIIQWDGGRAYIDCLTTMINAPDLKGVFEKNSRFRLEVGAAALLSQFHP